MPKFPKDALNLRMNPYNHGVSFVTKRKSFRKLCKCCDMDDLENCVGRAVQCACHGRVTYYFGVFDGCTDTLAHEVAHIVFMLFDNVGIDARHDDGEAFCYLLGWLMEQSLPKLKEAA